MHMQIANITFLIKMDLKFNEKLEILQVQPFIHLLTF